MSPRYEITLALSKQRGIQIADAALHLIRFHQLRQEESIVSELRVPLSTFLIFHSSYSHPPAPPQTAHAVFSSRTREERREESGAGSPQSERAERRYLKHMQRVQLRSGSPLLVGKEGQKVSDNGGLRSAARNPTHDDLCDLGDDDGPPSPPPPPPLLSPFALASFSFGLLVAISSFGSRLPDRHSRSAHSFDKTARSRKVRDTRFKSAKTRLPRNLLYSFYNNYRRWNQDVSFQK